MPPGKARAPPAAPRLVSVPPSGREGGDPRRRGSVTERVALARSGGPSSGRRAAPVRRATKSWEAGAGGAGEDGDPVAGSGPGLAG